MGEARAETTDKRLQTGEYILKTVDCRLVLLVFCFWGHIFFTQNLIAQETERAVTKTLVLMGSRFEVTAVSADDTLAWESIEAAVAEIQRIEELISSWDPSSQTSKINQQAGIQPVRVDSELFELIRRSLKISRLTGGAFDISYASVDKIWQFDGSMVLLPDSMEVAASVRKIDWQKVTLNADSLSVFLLEKGMHIGFGGIGKGYAANRARALMQRMGITSGLVNAGGDLIAWGERSPGKPWSIGIADPSTPANIFAKLEINNQAVVTSGSYEKFVEFEGKRYAHIIDPRTGWPVQELKSVTILCPDAELADALATAVFVLGPKEGLRLINQLKGISCVMVTDKNEILQSEGLDLNSTRN